MTGPSRVKVDSLCMLKRYVAETHPASMKGMKATIWDQTATITHKMLRTAYLVSFNLHNSVLLKEELAVNDSF
jgi:hypothetical protein